MRDLSCSAHDRATMSQDGGVMRSFVKYLLPLAVILPLAGFVAGSLATTSDGEPPPRTPIVLQDGSDSPDPDQSPTPGQQPTRGQDQGDDQGDDHGGDRGDDDDGDDDELVAPTTYEDDDHGDDDG